MQTEGARDEGILSDFATRGDVAVRELSIRFDHWDRHDYRLSASGSLEN